VLAGTDPLAQHQPFAGQVAVDFIENPARQIMLLGRPAYKPQIKKKPAASSGLNLFSWRRIEETVASCCIAKHFANLSL
jgi:hypothetical protein